MKKIIWVFLYIKYSKFWSVLLEHFVERKPPISKEWTRDFEIDHPSSNFNHIIFQGLWFQNILKKIMPQFYYLWYTIVQKSKECSYETLGRIFSWPFLLNKFRLGIQIRNMKMVFNIYGTWRWVTFEKFIIFLFG